MTLRGSGAALLARLYAATFGGIGDRNGNSGPRHERVGRVPLLRTQLQRSAGSS